MKLIPKVVRLPEPLAEALRTVAFRERRHQTQYLVDALADKLEAKAKKEQDSRVLAYLAEYRKRQRQST